MKIWKKALPFLFLFVVLHTVKDFFQDFLEWDVLTFADANENLWVLPKAGRWTLALANETAMWIGFTLVLLTPLVFKRSRPILERLLVVGYAFFLLTLAVDILLDPRLMNPQLFFDKSTRTPARDMKQTYQQILHDGPF